MDVGARQGEVLAKEATVEVVNAAVNVADALTKPVASTTMIAWALTSGRAGAHCTGGSKQTVK
eukprot:869156-Amphidinium_carterae.2